MTVESLCATTMIVMPLLSANSSIDCCTKDSLFESSADVASSKISILDCFINALAKDILCLCPPLKFTPLSPTVV